MSSKLRVKLIKICDFLGDAKPAVNGEKEASDKEEEEEGEIPEDNEVYYDKTKSFFDNIGSETQERGGR